MAANFSLFFAFYLLTPLLPLYLSEVFNAGKDTIGIVLSGYTLTALLARPLSGFLVDSFPRKRVLMICFALFFVFFAGYIAASTLLLFTLVRTLHGAPFGALTVANSTVAIDVLPSSRRNEGIGYYGLSNNLAMATAPSVAIYIYRMTNDFQLLFWLAFIIAGLGMLVDSGVRIKSDHKESKSSPSSSKKENSSVSFFSLDRFFLIRAWLLALNMALFGFCYGVLSNYLAIYGKEVMNITSGTGTYFLLLAGGLVFSRLQGASALRKGRLTHNAAEGVIISAAAYLLFVVCPNQWGFYGSAILLGLGNGHIWPAFQNMMIKLAHHNERGTANSTILVSWDVGICIGVLAGGVIVEHLGYTAAFWAVAFVQCVGTLLFLIRSRSFYQKQYVLLQD